MNLELIARSEMCLRKGCPALYRDQNGRLFIQGYVATEAANSISDLPSGEILVEIDQSLIEKIKQS